MSSENNINNTNSTHVMQKTDGQACVASSEELRVLEELRQRFRPRLAEGINKTCRFVSGSQKFNIKIANGKIENLTENNQKQEDQEKNQVDLELQADERTWSDILSRKITPQLAFMMGKLKLEGEISHAVKLISLFEF